MFVNGFVLSILVNMYLLLDFHYLGSKMRSFLVRGDRPEYLVIDWVSRDNS